jgi:phosphoribosylanthranilate isomerase
MSRVKVKICGVRGRDEARAAVEAGADALGFNLWPNSPRYVAPGIARELIRELPPFVASVGVFVNEGEEVIQRLASELGLSAVQLHGDESPEFCARLSSMRVIKALRVGPGFDVASIKAYRVNAVLLDTSVKNSYGGTGRSFDWSVAVEAKRWAPIILAGGLTVENVEDAIRAVRPFAVDVCSGVEAEPGWKDLVKLREFLASVHRANAENAWGV